MPYPINQRAHQFNLFWNHGGRAAAIVEGLRQRNRSMEGKYLLLASPSEAAAYSL